ncbi:MBL fold metallo-hydrolase, partial [Acinetobacter baumannii]
IPGQVQPTAGLLASKNLAAAGIDVAKIETIVVTHFHPDHVFGLMEKDSANQKFANAKIYVPAPELAFWTGDSLPDAAKGLGNRIKS